MRRRIAIASALVAVGLAAAAHAQTPASSKTPAKTAVSSIDPGKWLPAVRTRAWLTTSEERLKQAGVPRDKGLGVVTPLNDALVWLVAEDRPDDTRFVTVDEIEAAGLTPDQAKQKALENLRRVRPQMAVEGKNGRFRVVGERTFEASLALDEAWLRDKALDLHGDPVVAMPSTTMIFITDATNAAALMSLRSVVSRLYAEAGSSALSTELFVWRHGQLEILPVP
jgi:hypothetical protein